MRLFVCLFVRFRIGALPYQAAFCPCFEGRREQNGLRARNSYWQTTGEQASNGRCHCASKAFKLEDEDHHACHDACRAPVWRELVETEGLHWEGGDFPGTTAEGN